ncbi:hypothetical protein [Spartinivicinus poritis]|uniref:Galactose oxidase n=1 Tax=Spartinivicinus poritis TaxID=2994640 RepID=A0ABT5UFU5_9GAMM|nr:hypothetical protein [Spartinivicinus sp. A2-2]MDE1463949.1 hypothetical protein [Spartinivicinus sp. A2-2]
MKSPAIYIALVSILSLCLTGCPDSSSSKPKPDTKTTEPDAPPPSSPVGDNDNNDTEPDDPVVNNDPPPAPSQPAPDTPVKAGEKITEIIITHAEGKPLADYITFGHVFKLGEISANETVLLKNAKGNLIRTQVDKKATHPDGSLRHAIISAKVNLHNSQETFSLFKGTGANPGSPITRAQLQQYNFDLTLRLDVEGTAYQLKLADVIKNGTLEKQWLAGGIANEFIFSSPIKNSQGQPHPHLHARFYLRTYGSNNEKAKVSVIVENTYAYQPNPRNYTYNVTLTSQGKTLLQQNAVEHYHHARWKRDVILKGNDPLHIVFNKNYLINTKAFPLYDPSIQVDESTANKYYQNYQKNSQLMNIGTVTAYMPTTGGRADIGPLPGWTASYLISQDKRLKNVTLGNASQAGSWSIHYRNKETGQVVRIDKKPYAGLKGTPHDFKNPETGKSEAFPNCSSCKSPYKPDSAHQPSLAYLPYTLTGDYYYLEELQFWVTYNLLNTNPWYRRKGQGIFRNLQIRGEAWSLRTLGQAAYITPDHQRSLKSYFKQVLDNNLSYLEDMYINKTDSDRKGNEALIDNFAVRTGTNPLAYDNQTGLAPWMDDLHTWSLGFLNELGFTKAKNILDIRAKFSVERMLNPGFCWIFASNYSLKVRDNLGNKQFKTYRSFAEAFSKTTSIDLAKLPCNSKGMFDYYNQKNQKTLKLGEMVGYATSTEGFPSHLQIALAVVADSNYSNAMQAWETFASRSMKPNYNIRPQLALVPRSQYTQADDIINTQGSSYHPETPSQTLVVNPVNLPPSKDDTNDDDNNDDVIIIEDPDDQVEAAFHYSSSGTAQATTLSKAKSEQKAKSGSKSVSKVTAINDIVNNMKPGQWYYVNTHNTLADVFPTKPHDSWGNTGPTAVLSAWSGGAVGNGQLLLWGGGRSNYGGNEVYSLDLTTLQWHQLTEPSLYYRDTRGNCVDPNNQPVDNCLTMDQTPTAAHSYDAVQYLPNLGKFWMGPGTLYGRGKTTSQQQSYFFDSQSRQWTQQQTIPLSGKLSSAYDKQTGYILVANGKKMVAYDPVNNQIKHKSPTGPDFGGASPAGFAPDRRLFIQLLDSQVSYYDLSNMNWHNSSSKLPKIKTAPLYIIQNGKRERFQLGQGQLKEEPTSLRHYGIDYDTVNRVFVLWNGSSNTITLNPETWTLTEHQPTLTGNTPSQYNHQGNRKDRGIFGRWRYVPEWSSFIGYNDQNQGLWLYQLPYQTYNTVAIQK